MRKFVQTLFFFGGLIFLGPTLNVHADTYGVGAYGTSTYSGTPSTFTISSITSSPAQTSASITWTTSTTTSSMVNYGVSSAYAASTTETDVSPRVTLHTVNLASLSSCTQYHYQVESRDASGNDITSSDQTFITFGCGSGGGGGGGGGSSFGGGGSIYIAPTTSYSPTITGIIDISTTTKPSTTTHACINGALFNIMTGARCTNVSSQITISSGIYLFTLNLSVGMTNNQVKSLQQYLNANGFIVAKYGNGSAGNETTYFGSATKAALIKFQKASAIVPASGYFGPITRGYINAH